MVDLDYDDVLFVAKRRDFAGLTVTSGGSDRHGLTLKGRVAIENIFEPGVHGLFVIPGLVRCIILSSDSLDDGGNRVGDLSIILSVEGLVLWRDLGKD